MTHEIHFETLGCRLNQDETEGAARKFLEAGFICDLEPFTAKNEINNNISVCVVNTCTVTGKAEQKARRIIRLLLDKCPRAIIIVTGCYAEVEASNIKKINSERIVIIPGTKKYILSSIAEYFATTQDFDLQKTEEFVNNLLQNNQKTNLNAFTLYTPVFEKHSRGSIKIQDGCNCECTYCRIHLARGKSISLSLEEVVSRVKQLEKNGINEVVFTGVNLSQYAGTLKKNDDGKQRVSFAQLLKTLLNETQNIKFRISSFYPQSVNQELCNVIKDNRVQPSFHLSIQSGSDRILNLMKRPYKIQSVYTAVKMLRNAKENPFISCDIITGFPGETEEDFEETKKLCREIKFAWIHAFPFSPRPGTLAYTMKPSIPERIKDERVAWLTKIAVEGKTEYINYFCNKKSLSAIVENSRSLRNIITKQNSTDDIVIHAVTENFIHARCKLSQIEYNNQKQNLLPGKQINLQITNPIIENIVSSAEIEADAQLIF